MKFRKVLWGALTLVGFFPLVADGCQVELTDVGRTALQIADARRFYLTRPEATPNFKKFVERHFAADVSYLPELPRLLSDLRASETDENQEFTFEIPGVLSGNGNDFLNADRLIVSVQRIRYFDPERNDYFRVGESLGKNRGLERRRGMALRSVTLALLVYGAERTLRETSRTIPLVELKFIAGGVRVSSLAASLEERFGFYRYAPAGEPPRYPDYLLKFSLGR